MLWQQLRDSSVFRQILLETRVAWGGGKTAVLSEMTESIQSKLKEHKVSEEEVEYLILNLEKMSA